MNQARDKQDFWIGILCSGILHGLVVLGLFLFSGMSQSDNKIKIQSLTAEVLVRKGKKRPKHLLPRIYASKHKSLEKKRQVVEKKSSQSQKKRKKTKKRRVSDDDLIRNAMKKVRSLAQKYDPRGDDSDPTGDPKGHKDGTVDDISKQRLGSAYGRILRDKIDEKFHPPRIFSETQVENYKGKILVTMKINSVGRLIGLSLSRTSGNSRFDSSLLSAIRSAAPFPAPPSKIWKDVKNGITVSF